MKFQIKKHLTFLILVFTLFTASGCATWQGIKQDTSDGVDWTKEKVNQGAKYIEKKTE